MRNQDNVNSGQILGRFLCLVLVLCFSATGWTAAGSAGMKNIDLLDMTTVAPESWLVVPPSSSMRLAQFEISNDKLAEVIVFYFGAGQGGGPKANIARWVGQFRPVDGKPVKPTVDNMVTNGGFGVTWVEIQGDYARGAGVGPIGEYKPDQMLIAAITQTPRGNLYIQFHGERETVLEHRAEFSQFVMALQKKSI